MSDKAMYTGLRAVLLLLGIAISLLTSEVWQKTDGIDRIVLSFLTVSLSGVCLMLAVWRIGEEGER